MTASAFCPSCGTQAGAGAFCTGCGAHVADAAPAVAVAVATKPPAPLAGRASDELAGRACPYCRFPLKEAAEIIECRSCHAVHHSDCWSENSGCAINGCFTAAESEAAQAAGPTPVQSPAVTAAWAAGPPAAGGPAFAAASAPAPRRGGRTVLLVLAAMFVVAGVGTALYVALSKKSETTVVSAPAAAGGSSRPAPPGTNSDTSSGGGVDPNSGGVEPPVDTGLLPDVPQSQMRSDIQDMLLTWHEDIKAGSYQAAWNLLSRRKQRQDVVGGEKTYPKWVVAQAGLARYLDPSGIHVSIEALQRSEGVARVKVTGMGWSDPKSACSTWSGVTWVKYEGGEWRYDPGYSTTDKRTAIWEPRAGETLGWGC
jgi:hypothetical protein